MSILHFLKDIHCIRCNARATFHMVSAEPHAHDATPSDQAADPYRPRSWGRSFEFFSGLFICESCRHPTLIDFRFREKPAAAAIPKQSRRQWLERTVVMNMGGGQKGLGRSGPEPWGRDLRIWCDVVRAFPSAAASVPADVPEGIHRVWVEDIHETLGSPRMLSTACRAVLEMMCRDKGAEKGMLAAKIGSLKESGLITEEMKKWADEIRFSGNESVHDAAPVDAAHAREIHEFTRVLAEILYSYPARIKRLKLAKA